jgi:hypothetical protein
MKKWQGDDSNRRLTDVVPFGLRMVGRWNKEIRGLWWLGRGGGEGLGCLELVVEEETVQTPDEVE